MSLQYGDQSTPGENGTNGKRDSETSREEIEIQNSDNVEFLTLVPLDILLFFLAFCTNSVLSYS
jgi:hypothetical protein